jgi:ribose transport system substrate-binding protein
MVRDGDAIMVYPSPLTEAMADKLMTLKALTVVTNSLEIARRFSRNPYYVVIVVGGRMQFGGDSLAGSAGIVMLQGLRVNKAFLPCDGVSGAQGFACDDVPSAQMRAAMVNCAQNVIMLAMPECVGRAAAVSFAAPNQAQQCITTIDANSDVIGLLRSAGVRVSLCSDRLTEVCTDCLPTRAWRIGFANLREDDDFTAAVRQSLESAAQRRGVELMLVNNAADPQVAIANARRLIEAKVDLAIEFQMYERTNHAIMDLFRLANIPVIAVDIPMPGAIFYGADNYRAGRIAGEAAVDWIRRHWHGKLDKVVCMQQAAVGALPASRIDGQLDSVRAAINVNDRDIVQVEITHGVLDEARVAATQALRNIPWGKKVLFIGINADMALAALGAAAALDRQRHTVVVAQNVNVVVRRELERHNPMLIGAVDYFQEQYGSNLMQIALDLLEGRAVPPAIYTEHQLITSDDVRPIHVRHDGRTGRIVRSRRAVGAAIGE